MKPEQSRNKVSGCVDRYIKASLLTAIMLALVLSMMLLGAIAANAQESDFCRLHNGLIGQVPARAEISDNDIFIDARFGDEAILNIRNAIDAFFEIAKVDYTGTVRVSEFIENKPGSLSFVVEPRKWLAYFQSPGKIGISDDGWNTNTIVVLHEMGHWIGLGHVPNTNSIMCTDSTAYDGDCDGENWEHKRLYPEVEKEDIDMITIALNLADRCYEDNL